MGGSHEGDRPLRTVQRLSSLGLPEGTYKEVLNSAWGEFAMQGEATVGNGRYAPVLNRECNVNLPPIGAVVLERC